MKFSVLGQNAAFLIRHVLRQKLRRPLARNAWNRKKSPFIHEGDRSTKFRLYPGQYVDEQIFLDGIYERRFLELLSRRIRRGGAMLDVGANIGNHALYLRDRFDRIHCFEPNPIVVKRLEENLALNRVDNIRVHPFGLGAQRGELPFEQVEDNLSVSRFMTNGEAGNCLLPIVSADEWIEENGIEDVNYVKIDVEGFEGEVLRGLRRTIARFQPVISAEFSGHSSAKDDTERQLTSLAGYRLYEPLLEPGETSSMRKLGFYLSNAVNPPLVQVSNLESRYYPYLLALPPGRLAEFDIS